MSFTSLQGILSRLSSSPPPDPLCLASRRCGMRTKIRVKSENSLIPALILLISPIPLIPVPLPTRAALPVFGHLRAGVPLAVRGLIHVISALSRQYLL